MANDSVKNLLALHRSGQDEAAAATACALIEQHPSSLGLHFILGLSLHKLQRFEEAISAFERELQLTRELRAENKNADNAWKALVISTWAVDQGDRALAVAKRYWADRPSLDSGHTLMDIALALGGQDELIESVFKQVHPYRFKENPALGVAVGERRLLKDWCMAHQAEYFELEPAADVDEVDQVDGTPVRYRSAPIFVATIPHGRSVCGWDFVIAPNGEVLEDSGYTKIKTSYYFMSHKFSQVCNKVAYTKSRETIEIDDDVLFLSCPETFVFGHWVIDFLPRLMAWRVSGRKPLKIFCPANLPHHHKDTLALFGVRHEDLIEGKLGFEYRFRTLTVVRVGDIVEPPPRLVEFLYNGLGPVRIPRLQDDPEAIVFLERSQTNRGRYVANKDELDAVLREFGAITIRRPEVSITYQTELFARAGVVIGVFGSDIQAFQLRPHTDIIAIYFSDNMVEDDGLDIPFRRVCGLLKLRLHKFYSPPAPSDTKQGYRRDIVIDCQSLREKLTAVLAARRARRLPERAPTAN